MSTAVKRRGLLARLADISDGAIIRAAFFLMLAGTLTVLYIDYEELTQADLTSGVLPDQPVLPSFDPATRDASPGPAVTTDHDLLRNPLEIDLVAGGVLTLTGTIDPGSAERFADEIAARGEYVAAVAFDSPGGSVQDAIAIGRLINEAGFDTSVAGGALCASSCPLAFAGGKARHATAASAIGVHQIFAVASAGNPLTSANAAGDAMSSAQSVTADVTRHLTAMGVDPAMWIHALETPPTLLYYLSPEELTRYRLVTEMD
jgi:hypothetical protein